MTLQSFEKAFNHIFQKETDMLDTSDPLALLRIDATGRNHSSVSRRLATRLIEGLRAKSPSLTVTERDLTVTPPLVPNDDWIEAAYTPEAERTPLQARILAGSDELVDEFAAADIIVVTAPIYNFSIPAQLKLWIDQVARIGRTFAFTEHGPVPQLPDRPTCVIVPSGGTPIGSDIDFATGYLRHVLGFLGLSDVHVIEADQLIFEGETRIQEAEAQIDSFAAEVASKLQAAA